MEDNDINWEEELPANCPPKEAYRPNNSVFFRLVESYPPTDTDFHSTKKRSPNRTSTNECILRSCSLFSSYDACVNTRKSIVIFRMMKIVKLTLPPESGLILRTFRGPHHYSWWRSRDFDPIPCCVEYNNLELV